MKIQNWQIVFSDQHTSAMHRRMEEKVCLDSPKEGTIVPSLSVSVFSLTIALSFLSFSLDFLSLRQNFSFELKSASAFLEKSLENRLAASVSGCVE